MRIPSSTVSPNLPLGALGALRAPRALSTCRAPAAGLLLAACVLFMGIVGVVRAAPAMAVEEWGVAAPSSGTTIRDRTHLSAFATAMPAERVEAVVLRLIGPGLAGAPTRELQFEAGTPDGGRSAWGIDLEPLASWAAGGGPMANGRYRIEVQVRSSLQGVPQEPTGWQGHAIVLDVPPPATRVEVAVAAADARTFDVTWQPVSVPDFVRYEVERAAGLDGPWATVARVPAAGATELIDAVEEPGDYRYRVVVVRAGGDGGEATTASSPQAARMPAADPAPATGPSPSDPPDPAGPSGLPTDGAAGLPGDPSSPTPSPSASPGPGAGAAVAPTDGSGVVPGLPAPLTSQGTAQAPPQTLVQAPSITVSPGPAQVPARVPLTAPQGGMSPPGGDVFNPVLDLPQRPGAKVEQGSVTAHAGGVRRQVLEVFDSTTVDPRGVLVPIATGLLLTLVGLHLRRFLRS